MPWTQIAAAAIPLLGSLFGGNRGPSLVETQAPAQAAIRSQQQAEAFYQQMLQLFGGAGQTESADYAGALLAMASGAYQYDGGGLQTAPTTYAVRADGSYGATAATPLEWLDPASLAAAGLSPERYQNAGRKTHDIYPTYESWVRKGLENHPNLLNVVRIGDQYIGQIQEQEATRQQFATFGEMTPEQQVAYYNQQRDTVYGGQLEDALARGLQTSAAQNAAAGGLLSGNALRGDIRQSLQTDNYFDQLYRANLSDLASGGQGVATAISNVGLNTLQLGSDAGERAAGSIAAGARGRREAEQQQLQDIFGALGGVVGAFGGFGKAGGSAGAQSAPGASAPAQTGFGAYYDKVLRPTQRTPTAQTPGYGAGLPSPGMQQRQGPPSTAPIGLPGPKMRRPPSAPQGYNFNYQVR